MLELNISELKLNSPLILASGILGVSYSTMKRLVDAGLGAITTKSIGPKPRKGYKNPSIIEVYPGTFLNSVGLGNPGIDNFIMEIDTRLSFWDGSWKEGATSFVINTWQYAGISVDSLTDEKIYFYKRG